MRPNRASYSVIFAAIRIHQWSKNLLIFVPLVMAHQIDDISKIITVFIAFVAFSLSASATYLWNDIIDIESDRNHPEKQHRPIASGALSIRNALALSAILISVSVLASIAFVNVEFLAVLIGYIILTLSYSLFFKKKLLIDVLMLGGLYTWRLIAGGVAVNIVLSPWLLAFSIFFFLSLALVKRFSELQLLGDIEAGKISGRGYFTDDIEMIRSLGAASAYTSVLVLALYISSADVSQNYRSPELLWLICPALLYWLSRIWFLAHRGHMTSDPVIFAIRDRISLYTGLAILIILVAAWLFQTGG